MSQGSASTSSVGLESGRMIGCWHRQRHIADDVLGESARLPGRPDQDRRSHVADDLSEPDLPCRQASTRRRPRRDRAQGRWKSARVSPCDSNKRPSGPISQKRPIAVSLSNPSPTIASRSCSAIPTPAVPAPKTTTRWSAKRPRERFEAGKDRSQGDGSSALYVVVEGKGIVPPSMEDAPGVAGGEILPMQQRVREHPVRRLDERVDEGVVAILLHPRGWRLPR